ncbi:hypothetical protein GCM10009551_040250 [Nocardiopsis tropica]
MHWRAPSPVEGPVQADLYGCGVAFVGASDDQGRALFDVVHYRGQMPQGPPVTAHERNRLLRWVEGRGRVHGHRGGQGLGADALFGHEPIHGGHIKAGKSSPRHQETSGV